MDPFTIGIAGGTCAGKSRLAVGIQNSLADEGCVLLAMDDFYRPPSRRAPDTNFEIPEAINIPAFVAAMQSLQSGQSARVPCYDRKISSVTGWKVLPPMRFIVVEGLYVLYDEEVTGSLDIGIFMDVDLRTQLERRLARDVGEYGLSAEVVRLNHAQNISAAFERIIYPTRTRATLTLPSDISLKDALHLCMTEITRLANRK